MPKPDGITLEEMRAKLRDLGIPHDNWAESPGGDVKPPLVERQKDLLRQVRDLLQMQVDKDKEILAKLYEQKNRLERGGGV